MPNGNEYVDWDYMREHEVKTADGFARLERLEAEVLGDERAGRASLRVELSARLNKIYKLGWGLISMLLAKWVSEFLIFHK
jgi:hypothetical protein